MNTLSQILPDSVDFKTAILAAEEILLNSDNLISPEVIHHFSPGVYAREVRIPKGAVLTGKIHKTEHLCILNGDIEIASQDGKGRFTGYLTFLSKPGVKRIGYAHEDTVFTTIHAIEGTDISELERALVVDTFELYENYCLTSSNQELLA